jgi:hypothetical protein
MAYQTRVGEIKGLDAQADFLLQRGFLQWLTGRVKVEGQIAAFFHPRAETIDHFYGHGYPASVCWEDLVSAVTGDAKALLAEDRGTLNPERTSRLQELIAQGKRYQEAMKTAKGVYEL